MLGEHYRDGVNAEDALSVYRFFIAPYSVAVPAGAASELTPAMGCTNPRGLSEPVGEEWGPS